MVVWISIHILIVLLTFIPVVPCSYGPDLAIWMQRDEPGGFIEYRSYSSVWSNVGRTPPYRTWLCLARKSRIFRCHKTRRHISMMFLLLMLAGDVETNPGPVTRRNQQQHYGSSSKKRRTSYSHITAADVVQSIRKEELIKEFKPMLTDYRIVLLEANDLIDSDCRDSIQAKLRLGQRTGAATELVEYFETNHDGDKMMEFCTFLEDQAGRTSPVLKKLAKVIQECVEMLSVSTREESALLNMAVPVQKRKRQVETQRNQECISKLKEFYLRDSVIQNNLLKMSPGLQYIPLSYVKVEKEKKERTEATKPEIVEYDYMIRTVAQGSKCILLQGNPGSGKTTTLRKICHDFAKCRLHPEIRMVIRVVLGDMEKGSEMKDLLTTCIDGTHQDLIKDIGSYAEEVNGGGVLFLLDGFDELARDLQKKSLIVNIINGKAYPKSSCIITSRLSATAQLPPQAVQHMDCIETQGFTLGKMKQFIDRWFQTRPDTGKRLAGVIRHNPKLRDICLNPLIVLIACTIASEEQMLQDRMTELIKSFMCLLGNFCLQKTCENASIEVWEDLEEQCSSFKQLADLALHGFLEGQYTFKDRDASLPHCPSKLNHMGLFVITSQKKAGVVVKSYRFFHLVVQEFLSAYALSLKPSEDQTTFWSKHLVKGPIIETEEDRDHKSLYIDRRFETLFQFYAGLTRLQHVGIQQLLFNMVDIDKGLVLNSNSVACELFEVVYESQNVELAKDLFCLYKPSVTIEYVKSCDFQAFKWCLQPLAFSSLSLGTSLWHDAEQELEIVKQIFDTSKETLEDVHSKHLFGWDGAFVLRMIGACTKLKVLALDGTLKFPTRSFLNVLEKLTSLQTLSLQEIQLSDIDAETVVGDISRGIRQLKNLSDVTLMKCCGELTRGVVEGLTEHKCISKFKVGGLDEDIHVSQQSLVKFFSKSKSLQTLSLECVQLSDMDVMTVVGDISGGIQQHKNLSDVTLVDCCGEITRGVVEGLTDHKHIFKFKMKVLELKGDMHVSQQSLVNFFNKSASLQTLTLEGVQLSDMDVETVVGDISRGIQQHKNLSDVNLVRCCDELTRGVVEGLTDHKCIFKLEVKEWIIHLYLLLYLKPY